MDNKADFAELLAYSRDSADELDRATAVEAAAVLGGVSDVLAQMQGAGQDDCENCGFEIPKARRAPAPWAIRCAPCQSAREGKRL
jgi:RNA polymerase-binding transcription factor DksA